MKNKLIFYFTLVITLFLFSNVQAQNNPIQGKTIVMFGNSITYQGKWEEVIGRKDIVNWGLPGQLTGQLIWNIKNVLHDYPGTKIWFLEGGINDITLGVPAKRVFENYKIMVDSLKNNHIIPVVQSTILKVNSREHNKEVNKLNKMVKKYCLENKVEYIDLNAFLSKNGELIKELSTDGCHLKPDAYKPWGEAVKKVITKYNF